LWRQFAKHLARNGIGAAAIVFPYHMDRRLPREPAGRRFIANDVRIATQAYRQATSDISTVATWLADQPTVDPRRIGVVGVSLGAILAHAAMGQDPRLKAGVAMLGAGDLKRLRQKSILFALVRRNPFTSGTTEAERMLRAVDPLTTAPDNQPRHVLMVEAARDDLVSPTAARELWLALGKPPIQWIDTNHFALALDVQGVFRTTTAYLRSEWGMRPADAPIPRVHPPTITLGWVAGLSARPTLALQYQALAIGRRPDHIALLHIDAGLDGLGPFLGLAATVNRYVDAGFGARPGQNRAKPYISLHVAF
jgi:dienelactone hydrolase